MILTEQHRAEGALLPRWYGIAWADSTRHAYVVLPVPFNIIARSVREFWIRLRLPVGRDVLEDCWRDGYKQGDWYGYRLGKEAGLQLRLTVDEIRAELQEIKTELAEADRLKEIKP